MNYLVISIEQFHWKGFLAVNLLATMINHRCAYSTRDDLILLAMIDH